MDFKCWLEVNDIKTANVEQVNLEPVSGLGIKAYGYTFNVNGRNYNVIFKLLNKRFVDQFGGISAFGKSDYFGNDSVPVWDVTFTNPHGSVSLTNLGSGMFPIYKNVMLAIKKLMQIEDVKVLDVYPSRDEMKPIYYKFFKNYLSDKYMVYDDYHFVRKDFIQEIQNKLNPSNLAKNKNNISSALADRLKAIEIIKKQKLIDMSYKKNWQDAL